MEIAAQDNKKNYSNLDSNIFRSEGYVKVSEAANLLNVSSSTLRRFEAEGKISSRRLDNNYRVYDVSEVARFKKILDEEKQARKKSYVNVNDTSTVTVQTFFQNRSSVKPFKFTWPKINGVLPNLNKTHSDLPQNFAHSTTLKTAPGLFKTAKFAVVSFAAILLLAGLSENVRFTDNGVEILSFSIGTKNERNEKGYEIRGLTLGSKDKITSYIYNINVPANFRRNVNIDETIRVTGLSSLLGGIETQNADANLGTGTLTTGKIDMTDEASLNNLLAIDDVTETTLEEFLDIKGDVEGTGLNDVKVVGLGGIEVGDLDTDDGNILMIEDGSWASLPTSSITSLGTITTGVWNGTTIAPGYGGTGLTTVPAGSILVGSSGNTMTALTIGSPNQILMVSGSAPVWSDSDAFVSSYAWMLAGNTGTDDTTDFIGTADSVGLTIRTNDVERIYISADGNVGIGGTDPQFALHVGNGSATAAWITGQQESGYIEGDLEVAGTIYGTFVGPITTVGYQPNGVFYADNTGTMTTDNTLLSFTETTATLLVNGTLNTNALKVGGTAVTASATELNIMDGATLSTTELNLLTGRTGTLVDSNNVSNYAITSLIGGSGLLGGTGPGATTLHVGAGNGISVAADSIAIDTATTGTTAVSSSNSGLEASSDGLRLLGGCGSNQILSWDAIGQVWKCASVSGIGGITGAGAATQIAFWDSASSLTGNNNLWWNNASARLGIGTSAPLYSLDVAGTARIGSLSAGSGNEVVTQASGVLESRTIDSRVWGSTLVDGTSLTSNYLARISDANSLVTGMVYDNGTFVGIGTTANSGYILNVGGSANISTLFIAGSAVTASATELNILDGVTATTSEINMLAGRTGTLIDTNNIVSYAVTAITAGSGLTGGTGPGATTINIGAGNGITLSADSITIDSDTTGTTSVTSNNSGLEVTTSGLRLLGGCGNGEVLKWNSTASVWYCAADTTGSGTATIAGSGLATQVAFFSASTSISGSNNLWWDNAQTRLGIGTSGPLTNLDVSGTIWLRGLSANSGLFVNESGYTGIGTTNPIAKFQVEGTTWLRGGTGVAGAKGVYIDANSNLGIGTTNPAYLLTLNTTTDQHAIAFLEGTTNRAFFGLAASAGQFAVGSRDNDLIWRSESGSNQLWTTDGGTTAMMTLNSGGNLGIGTTAPLAWFDVRGATASEASLRIRSGTQPTVPATGDIYNDGDQLFFYNGSTWQDLGATAAGGGGVTGTGVAGQLTFFTGSTAVSGSNNLFWDTSNSRLGLGTTAPASLLSLLSTDTTNGQFRIGYDASNYTKFTADSLGNITLNNNGTNVVKFGSANTEFYTPTTFSAAGDVSMAYDLIFTNATSSELRSYGPLSITAGETYGSSNLTLKTYNAGDIVADLTGTGRFRLNGADTTLLFDTKTATDTDFWMGVIDDASASDNDIFVIGKGLTNNTNNYLTIASSGFVGLGLNSSSAPSAMLDVNGGARFRGISSSAYVGALNYSTGGYLTTATSDARLKTNVTTIDNALDKVMQLRGVTFNWLDPNVTKRMTGMIAQEVEQVMPELVFQNPNDGYYGMFYGETTGLLVEATKELNTKLLAMESGLITTDGSLSTVTASSDTALTKVNTLETDVATLQAEVLSIKDLLAQATPQSTESSASIVTTPEGMLTEMYKVFEDLKAFVSALGLSTNAGTLTVSTDMSVLGETTLSNLTVTGDINAGLMKLDTLNNVFEIAGPSCYNELTNTTNGTLCTDQTMYLQKSLAGNVDVLNGALLVEPNGNVTVKGTLLAQKVETTDVTTENVTIKAASKSVGNGTILKGQTQLVIDNTLIKAGSKVFVTATSSTGGQALIVKEKLDGVSFTVELDRPVAEDVAFDWWVVNVE